MKRISSKLKYFIIIIVILISIGLSACNNNVEGESYNSLQQIREEFLKNNVDFKHYDTFNRNGNYYNVYYSNDNVVYVMSVSQKSKDFIINKRSHYFKVKDSVTYVIDSKYGIKCFVDKVLHCQEEFV